MPRMLTTSRTQDWGNAGPPGQAPPYKDPLNMGHGNDVSKVIWTADDRAETRTLGSALNTTHLPL